MGFIPAFSMAATFSRTPDIFPRAGRAAILLCAQLTEVVTLPSDVIVVLALTKNKIQKNKIQKESNATENIPVRDNLDSYCSP